MTLRQQRARMRRRIAHGWLSNTTPSPLSDCCGAPIVLNDAKMMIGHLCEKCGKPCVPFSKS